MTSNMLIFFWIITVCCFGSTLLDQMSLEEKVGQILMVHFHGESVNHDAKILVQEVKAGAIIYYNWSNGLTSPQQVQNLSAGLQKLASETCHAIPLLIATDQEGGVVTRLRSGFTNFPGNWELGKTGDPHLAENASFIMGKELSAVGINMNLAPVVDINTNPKNPVIGARSFGDTPEIVITFGKQSLLGFKKAGIITTLKHFPGHGDVSVDPHEALPVLFKSKEELELLELRPFAELAPFTDAIMTAHILAYGLDPKHCTTLSKSTLRYLRDVIGFQGLIVSDSLVMDGVLNMCHSVDEASIIALDAGCDLLILGGKLLCGEHKGSELTISDVQRIHRSIMNAVTSGRLSEERLNQAVEKVLTLKFNKLPWP